MIIVLDFDEDFFFSVFFRVVVVDDSASCASFLVNAGHTTASG